MKEKVYISGKITGYDNYMRKFELAESRLADMGYTVINPARINRELPRNTYYDVFMKIALSLLFESDAIYMLDNWEDSPGANAEHALARALRLNIMYEGKGGW